jgi:chromosome segregation ATPase
VHDRSDRLEAKVDQVLTVLAAIQSKEEEMSKELDDLEVQVAQNTTVEEGAVTLLNGLAAQIEALKNDPVKLQALATSLKASGDDLAAAVAANTPAAPTP